MILHLKLFANQVKSIIMAINQTIRHDPVAMIVTFCKQLFALGRNPTLTIGLNNLKAPQVFLYRN